MAEAACRNTDDPDAFFPERGQSRRRLKAQKICMTCPVLQECGDYRFRMQEKHGIWAGKLQKRNQKD